MIAYYPHDGCPTELRLRGFSCELSVVTPAGIGLWCSQTVLDERFCQGIEHSHSLDRPYLSAVEETVGPPPPPMSSAALAATLARALPRLDFWRIIGGDFGAFCRSFTGSPGKFVGVGSRRRQLVSVLAGALGTGTPRCMKARMRRRWREGAARSQI